MEKPDIICGGFPCQDISIAGKQKGINADRSGLWKEFKRLISEIEPKYAIIENVGNLRSNGLITVLQDLWKIRYDAEWHIIPAWSVGSLQLRERVWILAYPSGGSKQQSSTRSHIGGFQNKILQEGGNQNNVENKPCFPLLADAFSAGLAKIPTSQKEPAGIKYTAEKLSGRVHYIRQLGNTVIPDIPEIIGRAILKNEINLNREQ